MFNRCKILIITTTSAMLSIFQAGCYTYQLESAPYYTYKVTSTYSKAKGSSQPFRTFYNIYNGIAELAFDIGELCKVGVNESRRPFVALGEFGPGEFDPNSCTGAIYFATVVPNRPCHLAVRLVWQCQTNEKLGDWDTNLWTDAVFRIRASHHDKIFRRDDVFYDKVTEPKKFAWISECKDSDNQLIVGPSHDVVWSLSPYSRPFFYFDPMQFSIEVIVPNSNPQLRGMRCRAFVVENPVK